jgi:hypothetical protein
LAERRLDHSEREARTAAVRPGLDVPDPARLSNDSLASGRCSTLAAMTLGP